MLFWEAAAEHIIQRTWPDRNVSVLQVNFWKPGQTAGVYAPGKRGKNLGLLTKKPRETDSRAPL